MAIDDNTTYGLTGAQVKELPGKIEAVRGLAKVLTSADYNWPTNNPDKIAVWLLEPGIYTVGENATTIAFHRSGWNTYNTDFSFVHISTPAQEVSLYSTSSSTVYWTVTDKNGGLYGNLPATTQLLKNTEIKDNLTTTSDEYVLSAKQGKVLKDLVDSLAIRGAGAPTTSTAGSVGTLYEDTTNGDLYICTSTTGNVYTWEEVGAGGGSSYVAGDGISIDEESGAEVISATNTGEAKILTTDDYNWPTTGTKTSVALWLVEPGVYDASTNGATVSVSSGSTYNNGIFLVSGTDNNVRTIVKFEANTTNPTAYVTNANTGASIKTKNLYTEVVNNLTSTNTDKALSAKQGKVLDEKIPTITMTTTDPGEGSALAANNFVAVYGTDGDAGYALAETNTGTTWVDGSTIYKKTINFGALPNATTKSVDTGIADTSYIVKIESLAFRSTNKTVVPLPFIDTTNLSRGINLTIATSNSYYSAVIVTNVDRSDFDECYITLYYTKAS